MDYSELAKAFGAFFAIMNPFINLPIFLSLTDGYTVTQQRALAVKITIYSAVMCVIILFAGRQIIGFFGISIDEFRVAGGAVLAGIAWSMLHGGNVTSHQGGAHEQAQIKDVSSLAFYPITFPMIVGPGTIATLIIYSGHAWGMEGMVELVAIIGAVLLLLFAVLFFAAQIGKIMSQTLRTITTRLMGMILLAIAVDMIVAGLTKLLPGLAGAT
jgi:multiple antibiotic resistance protein